MVEVKQMVMERVEMRVLKGICESEKGGRERERNNVFILKYAISILNKFDITK